MIKASAKLRDVLKATGLVDPVDTTGGAGSVSCLCRQFPGKEARWLRIVDGLLAFSEQNKINVHVCRRYVRKNGQMVFGWFVGVTADSAKKVSEDVESLCQVVSTFGQSLPPVQAPAPAPVRTQPASNPGVKLARTKNGDVEVLEFPLPHVSKDLNVPNAKEKGANYIGGGDA